MSSHLIKVASFPLSRGISLNVVRGSVVYFGLHDVIDNHHFKKQQQSPPPSNSKTKKNLNNVARTQGHGDCDEDSGGVGDGDEKFNSSEDGRVPTLTPPSPSPTTTSTTTSVAKKKILAIVNAANERCLVRPGQSVDPSRSLRTF